MARTTKYKQSAGCLGIASNGATAVTIYTFSASLVSPDGTDGPGGIVDMVRVYNSDTVLHITELHLVPSGDTAGDDTLIDRVTLQPDEVYRFYGPERAASGAFMQIKLAEAHTTTAVYAKADVTEITV